MLLYQLSSAPKGRIASKKVEAVVPRYVLLDFEAIIYAEQTCMGHQKLGAIYAVLLLVNYAFYLALFRNVCGYLLLLFFCLLTKDLGEALNIPLRAHCKKQHMFKASS